MVSSAQLSLWYVQSEAQQGKAAFQYELGRRYLFGEGGVTKDVETGVKWLRLAAEQGTALAQYNLGVAYDNGYVDGTHNIEMAMYWFRKAAQQGDAMAIEAVSKYENWWDNPVYRTVNITGLSNEEALLACGLKGGKPPGSGPGSRNYSIPVIISLMLWLSLIAGLLIAFISRSVLSLAFCLVLTGYLTMLDNCLRGRPKVSAFLGICVPGLIVLCFISFGWKAGLASILGYVLVAGTLRPLAKLHARHLPSS